MNEFTDASSSEEEVVVFAHNPKGSSGDPGPISHKEARKRRKLKGAPSKARSSRTVAYLIRIQRYSPYVFSIFATAHFANTALIPLFSRRSDASSAVASADSYMLLARPYYQSPINEAVLIVVPLGLHVAAGVGLRLYRRHLKVIRERETRLNQEGSESLSSSAYSDLGNDFAPAKGVSIKTNEKTKPPTGLKRVSAFLAGLAQNWPEFSGIAILGHIVAPSVLGHVLMTRIAPILASSSSTPTGFALDGNSSISGLEYVAHGFAKHPLTAKAGFAALITTVSFHVVWGWAHWLKLTPSDGTIRNILPAWLLPSQSSSWFKRVKRMDYLEPTAREVDKDGRLSVVGRRNRNRWWAINATAATVAGLWMASAFGVVAQAGRAHGWVGHEYDRIYQHIPVLGSFF